MGRLASLLRSYLRLSSSSSEGTRKSGFQRHFKPYLALFFLSSPLPRSTNSRFQCFCVSTTFFLSSSTRPVSCSIETKRCSGSGIFLLLRLFSSDELDETFICEWIRQRKCYLARRIVYLWNIVVVVSRVALCGMVSDSANACEELNFTIGQERNIRKVFHLKVKIYLFTFFLNIFITQVSSRAFDFDMWCLAFRWFLLFVPFGFTFHLSD